VPGAHPHHEAAADSPHHNVLIINQRSELYEFKAEQHGERAREYAAAPELKDFREPGYRKVQGIATAGGDDPDVGHAAKHFDRNDHPTSTRDLLVEDRREQLPEPALERVVVVSAMPDRLKHEAGNGHRCLQTHQRRPTSAPDARAHCRVAERSGDRGDVVGLGYDPQGALEVRHADRNASLEAALREHAAHEAVGVPTERIDDHVLERTEAPQRQLPLGDGVILAHDAEKALAEKVGGPQLMRQAADFGHDEEIQPATRELREDVATCGFDLHVEQRCASHQSRDEFVDDGSEGVLGLGNAHGPGRSGRVERTRRTKEAPEPVEAGRERHAQPGGASGARAAALRARARSARRRLNLGELYARAFTESCVVLGQCPVRPGPDHR
jgi:hypothetical protein